MAHILIVDDSPTDVKVLSGMLERAGHRVTSAASAESGIDLAKSARPDLILSDGKRLFLGSSGTGAPKDDGQ